MFALISAALLSAAIAGAASSASDGNNPATESITATSSGNIPGTAAATRCRKALACTAGKAPVAEVIVTLALGLMSR
ncbi:MAG: hypothetical protein ACD_54C00196G0005 [uncultured bacterium]|nr:MAG: hypothetical protein ACD_54C00196G0005 [uncultured bacterium]